MNYSLHRHWDRFVRWLVAREVGRGDVLFVSYSADVLGNELLSMNGLRTRKGANLFVTVRHQIWQVKDELMDIETAQMHQKKLN